MHLRVKPNWLFQCNFRKKEKETKQCRNFNYEHVFIDNGYYENLRGRVFKSTDHSRSYVVDILNSDLVVRNLKFLKLCIENCDGHFVQILTEQNGYAENNKN